MKLADIVERVRNTATLGRWDAGTLSRWNATLHSEDKFGRRYTVDLGVQGTEGRQGLVRTGWFVPRGAREARLATLYVRR